jgi:hypothetical protein
MDDHRRARRLHGAPAPLRLAANQSQQPRFVRAALFSNWANPAKTAPEAVNLGFHVLNTFDIFDWAIKSDVANQTENAKAFLKSDGEAARRQPTSVVRRMVFGVGTSGSLPITARRIFRARFAAPTIRPSE